MVFIEGDRLKLKNPLLIEHITIFKITGECIFDKDLPIDEYLDILIFGDETLLAVINTKTKITQIVKIYEANAQIYSC